ncbi:hypothetical protein COCC4DRAFT_32415 [Bipolaris maydis ATCC 48331]|uniref:Uncharacterized protein n=2 Tax=Cochliobolus heterostrophus TaxID=5016 RepID=M2UGJ4_COCH5|nr:uncharacterized protein COCC4DRAFT_32415 [Bipolaris maydis ATCC 48331]EMD92826.1 hypothetical protein COCHEDRAFT_1020771 [Bipolaris maydis C5]ENI04785.1 hypothetical protein COCC4DRAFT_32415 [Bipolaris maydis ATCC 48331]
MCPLLWPSRPLRVRCRVCLAANSDAPASCPPASLPAPVYSSRGCSSVAYSA